MPVRKFRSVADMPGPPPLRPLDPDNLRRAVEMLDLGARLFRMELRPGVRKFRSLDEAHRQRDEREQATIRARRRGAS